jgi:hypothetical protein
LLQKAHEVERFASDPEKLALLAREESESTGAEVTPEEMRTRLTAGSTFLTQTNRGWTLAQMARSMLPLQHIVFEMDWMILLAPDGDPGFLTSDNPVSLFSPAYHVPGVGLLSNPDAHITFPISREICLLARHRQGRNHRVVRASAVDVRRANKGTILRADTQLYAPFQSQEIQRLHDSAVMKRGKPKRVMIKKGRVVED